MPPRKPASPVDPVNSEQLEMQESEREDAEDTPADAPQAAQGPSVGELEERAAEAEERADAAERRVASVEGELQELRETIAKLMRAQKPASSDAKPRPAPAFEIEDERPILDIDRPFGTVIGDTLIAFEQDGHQFGHDREYVQSLPVKLRGTGRPFNPRLVGVVMPRHGQARTDGLDGIRGRE